MIDLGNGQFQGEDGQVYEMDEEGKLAPCASTLRSAMEILEEGREKERTMHHTIFRVEHNVDNPFIMVCRKSMGNPKLSAKAKGIWAYCLGMRDGWEFYLDELTTHFTDGKDAIRSGLHELEDAHYIKKGQKKNKNGQFDGWEYVIYETPYE